jgi:hypothetical protein
VVCRSSLAQSGRKAMTHEINGFVVEPSTNYRRLFRRVTEPRHEYIFWITPNQVELRATLPDDVGVRREDALHDAERSEKDARKAAEDFRRRTFG